MDWDDYRYFLAVADAGSLSAAARRLGQSHSTILRRLDKLEAALAVRLFERFQTGYVLTAAGDELQALLAPLAQQLADVERQVGGRDTQLAGTIRITTTDTLLQALLLPALADFRRAYPGIALQVTVNNSFLNLTRREADVAIRPTNTPPDNLVGRKLGRVQTAPYSTSPRTPADDWTAYDWVAPDEALAHLAQARWLREHVPSERWVFSADTLVGMAAAVEAGIGAGMLLCLLADARPNLIRLAPPPPALDTDVWLLTHPDLRRVSRIRALTEFLAKALATHPALS
ncbi:LysR family transcriptional regulator [Pseudoduganella armeniaca]|uniref:LysR family transcriptional regulator n=1 Tax=Pseudoduganella armeniaca TaxID=2072590 RepID=A0A2R4C4Z2_9BURK|nr:LysR family transcriptional regulator [Pseudoduganella armeniaca]AVR94641.1 LysR family transcriptional regulator [Pseudoduganella armeniaca]